MPRRIPFTLRTEMAAPASGEEQIVLATLSGGGLTAPIYAASDWVDVLSADPFALGVHSGGHVFKYVRMAAEIPSEDESAPPSCNIVFENVSSDMVSAVRSGTTMIDAELKWIYASDVEAVIDPWLMKCERATYDNNVITLPVARDDDMVEPAAHITSKNRFPGLYA